MEKDGGRQFSSWHLALFPKDERSMQQEKRSQNISESLDSQEEYLCMTTTTSDSS